MHVCARFRYFKITPEQFFHSTIIEFRKFIFIKTFMNKLMTPRGCHTRLNKVFRHLQIIITNSCNALPPELVVKIYNRNQELILRSFQNFLWTTVLIFQAKNLAKNVFQPIFESIFVTIFVSKLFSHRLSSQNYFLNTF